jgi:cyclase
LAHQSIGAFEVVSRAHEWAFSKGLHDVGNGCFAWLQPDGGWGLSNAGLVTDGEESLLVDTLFDLPLTHEMLGAMKAAVPAAAHIGTIVNTHFHPDHTAGNSLLHDATVIASHDAIEDMQRMSAGHDLYGTILRNWSSYGDAGAYLQDVMGSRFRLDMSGLRLPTRSFETELQLQVGDKEVRLIKLGPAHTRGDVVVYLPRERVLYTGDVLFHEVHPATAGEPISAWLAVCDRLLGWDIEVVVPGHGPIGDLSAVRRLRDYFAYFQREARARFDAGLPLWEAALDISLDAFRGWADEERILMTLAALYREFGAPPADPVQVLGMAHRYRRAKLGKRDGGDR